MDIKITDYCDGGCPYCHEDSTLSGRHGDLDAISGTMDSLHPGTELAIGGGNALAHPAIIPFLEKLKDTGIVSNMNHKSASSKAVLRDHIRHRRIRACARHRNLPLPTVRTLMIFDFIDTLGENVVIHTIAGILSEKDIPSLEVPECSSWRPRRGHAY